MSATAAVEPAPDPAADYHDLLTAGGGGEQLAADSQGQLDRQLAQRGLFFGDRPLCTVLRPRFLRAAQYDFLQRRAALVLGAFTTAYRAAMRDAAFRAQFRLAAWEEALVADAPRLRDPSPVSRLDAFFSPDGEVGGAAAPGLRGLRFTEYNAETPAGAAYNDVLTELFYGLPAMRELLKRWDLRPLPARHNVLHALLDAWHQFSGRREVPRVAILDWAEVPTYSEFLLFRDYFTRQGVPCVIADPREVEYTGGRLVAGGAPVELIYKRVLISELVERGGLDQPVVRAVRDGAVCLVNPFHCKLLHKKASLAVLGDERNAALFTADERAAIAAHVPWTRVVEERRTEHDGAAVDLVPYVAARRERFVLKPNDEYGGKGIVLGWEVDQAAWEAALRTALAEPYIVQERVALPSEPYPSWADGRVHVLDRMLDTAPYVAYGAYVDGCLTRLSTAALLNVTAGGGSTVPTFVAERRG
ncbi:MAG TPA: hypothetical protein VFS08_04530 [Gemmatimonadaceae bacterium]|nr:hypothetical protein [Gemmatimonadaceae bacterium]